jgi:hypothetical protein
MYGQSWTASQLSVPTEQQNGSILARYALILKHTVSYVQKENTHGISESLAQIFGCNMHASFCSAFVLFR